MQGRITFFILLTILSNSLVYAASFNFNSTSSSLYIKSGANFIVENPIDNWNGILIKDKTASVSGNLINFTSGRFQEADGDLFFSGSYNPTGTITLNGSQAFRSQSNNVYQSLNVANGNNTLQGTPLFINDITIKDKDSSLSVQVNNKLANNIILNGGSLILNDDLSFADGKSITGSGQIFLNRKTLHLGSLPLTFSSSLYFINAQDVQMNANVTLNATWTFTGSSVIQGNNNLLFLDTDGKIVVDANSTLLIKDTIIRNVGGYNIQCVDNTSTITLQNTRIIQNADYTFTTGSLFFKNNVGWEGKYNFYYSNANTSTIDFETLLHFTNGIKVNIGRALPQGPEPLYFSDITSSMRFENAALTITPSGMAISQGLLEYRDDVQVDIQSTTTSNGFIQGDPSKTNFETHYFPGCRVTYLGGHLTFKSINPNSTTSRSSGATIYRTGGIFNIEQDVALPSITVNSLANTSIMTSPNIKMTFQNSIIVTPLGDFTVSGSYYNDTTFLLNSNDYMLINKGSLPVAAIVNGTNVNFFGSGSIYAPIIQTSPTDEMIMNINGSMLSPITLAGGSMVLINQLAFGQDNTILGSGTVVLDGNKLKLGNKDNSWTSTLLFNGSGGKIELNSKVSLSSTLSFQGNCVLDGNKNILNLSPTAKIVVMPNSTLTLQNMFIENVKNYNITCHDDTASIIMRDMSAKLSGDYTFSSGSIFFKNNVDFSNSYTFFYSSHQTSTIAAISRLAMLRGVRFELGKHAGSANESLAWEDVTAHLLLNDSDFAVTRSGLTIAKGEIEIAQHVNIDVNSTSTLDGLILGDSLDNDNFEVHINPAAHLSFRTGHFVYKSGNPESIISRSQNAILSRLAPTVFNIQTNLILSNITVNSDLAAQLNVENGINLTYEDCVLELPQGEFEFTGSRYSPTTNLLDTNDFIECKQGSILPAHVILGVGNRIYGNANLLSPTVLLAPTSELWMGLNGFVFSDITLNGGTLYLMNDLNFGSNVQVGGPGTVNLDDNKLSFGAQDFSWTSTLVVNSNNGSIAINSNVSLSSTLTFSGICTIDGQGNTLSFDPSGNIVLQSGATILFKDITLKNIQNSNISCLDDSCHVFLQNVDWYQSNNFTFSTGSIEIKDYTKMVGNNLQIAYQSTQPLTINQRSKFILDTGFTFSYDPSNESKNLITFIDDTSILSLKNANLYVTKGGLDLIDGSLHIRGNSKFQVEPYTDTGAPDNGISFGSGDILHDLSCHIFESASLQVLQGSLRYRNVSPSSWVMGNMLSSLQIGPSSTLVLLQDLNLGGGQIVFEDNSTLGKAGSSTLFGNISINGTINYQSYSPFI